MQVFILSVAWCLNAHPCTSTHLHWTTEGVFESLNECNARGAYLTKGEPRPTDWAALSSMALCEPWEVTPRGSPLSTAGKANPFDHVPPISEKR